MRRALPVLVVVGVFSAVPVGAVAADPVVDVQDDLYSPDTVTVPAGVPVVWHQSGLRPHTVTATDGSWDSHPDCGSNYEECMLYGDRYERSFPEPGTYEYFCRIHGTSMAGTVIVTEAEPSPTESPSPSPLPSATASPTVTVPAVTTSPSPSPSTSRTSEQPSQPPPPSVEEPSSGTPSVEPSSPAASASPSVTPSASARPSASESDLPLGIPAAGEVSRGMGGLVVVLVALLAVGLAAFGYWQLRTAKREAGP